MSARWMRLDALVRLLPFLVLVTGVQVVWHPRWLGVSAGDVAAQVIFGIAGAGALFAGATAVQLALSRRRGVLRVPAGSSDAMFQAAYYVVNAPIEEAFFRGLLQGGLGVLVPVPVALIAATAAYSLYHRLGAWAWPDVAATAIAGLPLALAFWLLPGPPSVLGVAIAHVGATCGFLGPGPWLLRRLRLVG